MSNNRSNINLVGNTTQGQNIGTGEGEIYSGKINGNNLQFRTIKEGPNVKIIQNGDDITISATTSSGGDGNPGGIDGELQYNNNGSFGGSGLCWDNSVSGFSMNTPAQENVLIKISNGQNNYESDIVFLSMGAEDIFFNDEYVYGEKFGFYTDFNGDAQLCLGGYNGTPSICSGGQLSLNSQRIGIYACEPANPDLSELILCAGKSSTSEWGYIRLNGNICSLFGTCISFFGQNLVPKQTVTGSRDGNAALQSLLTALSGYGLINDDTTT